MRWDELKFSHRPYLGAAIWKSLIQPRGYTDDAQQIESQQTGLIASSYYQERKLSFPEPGHVSGGRIGCKCLWLTNQPSPKELDPAKHPYSPKVGNSSTYSSRNPPSIWTPRLETDALTPPIGQESYPVCFLQDP